MRRCVTIGTTLIAVGTVSIAGFLRAGDAPPTAPTKGDAATQTAAFDRNVAPLIARRCLGCHSGTQPKGKLDLSRTTTAVKGGDSGTAIVPGKPERSLLWQRVRDNEMPPKKPLSAKEKAVLKAWIAGGAKWGTDPIDPFKFTTASRAGYDWWALQPVRRLPVPQTGNAGRARNPIDAFVLRKLKEHRLQPSPEADRRTLIRRLSFDLLGLPPTPEETAAFVNDPSPLAYERLVDRLLASPQFGERWGRHWLDVVRFGESQGFERDKLRTNSWRYRDWVVAAFNADMPYDRFAKMQLAGDALRPGNASAIVATGFLVAGPYDEVGQSQQSAAMRAVVRQDELEDVVSAVGQGFLGLTVHCARCHDHKFDPIRQVEYYRMTAALAGVRHGARNVGNLAFRKQADARRAALQARIEILEHRLRNIEETTRERLLADKKTKPHKPVSPPRPIAAWDFRKSLKDEIGKLDARSSGKAVRDANGLKVDGKGAHATTPPLTKALKTKTLEAWVQLDNLTQRGGGVISVQTLNGGLFDAIVFGEREPGRWMAGSNVFARTQSFGGPPERAANRKPVHVAIAYSADGTIRGYVNGHPYGKAYRSSGPVTFAAGKAQVIFGVRHFPPGGNRMLAGRIQRARLYDRALTSREVAASAGVSPQFVTDDDVAAALSTADRRRVVSLRFEIEQLRSQITRWAEMQAYCVAPRAPGTGHLLKRGNPAAKGRVVSPGGVAALGRVNADFGLKPDAPDSERRIKLAGWIADERNPLFARVIVNRLWQHHFGRGIVATPSDFGFNGVRPTHPELLDWLAAELVRNNWSLKSIHRLIVTSAAYRQASRFRRDAVKIDAGNRFLWRMTPRRLEAEAVRDAILKVAGEMNPAVGGPGFYDFTTFTSNSQFYRMRDPDGAAFQRRSLYRTWVRSGRNRFLDVFDCPDPSTKTPRRAVTTTPLQALSLLNNSFVLRMSERLAQRVQREAPDDPAQQIQLAWRLVYSRAADAAEQRAAAAFARKHGLAALCRVLLNGNEFLYVD